MRPIELTPLFASLQSLTGIGPRLILLMRKCVNLPAGITEPRVLDLLWHLPSGVIDRRAEPAIAEAVPGSIANPSAAVVATSPTVASGSSSWSCPCSHFTFAPVMDCLPSS